VKRDLRAETAQTTAARKAGWLAEYESAKGAKVAVSAEQLQLPHVPEGNKYDYWPFVTVATDRGLAVRGEALANLMNRTDFRWYTSWSYSEIARYADEGVLWIRGWHEPTSSETHALLAAAALYRSRSF